MPRPLLFLLLSLVFGGFSSLVSEPDEAISLAREAARLQEKMDRVSADLHIQNEELLEDLSNSGADDWMRSNVDVLERQRERTGTTHLGSRGDSLIVWTGSPPLRPSSLVGDTASLIKIGEAIYLHAYARTGEFELHALRPIWLAPPLENRYIKSGFHPSLGVAEGAAVAIGGQLGPEVYAPDGLPAFRMAWRDGALETSEWIWLRTFLIALTVGFLIAALWYGAAKIAARSRWAGLLFFIFLLIALRWWSLAIPPIAPFDRFPLFDPALYAASFVFPSMGDLLINSILLLVVAAFARAIISRAPLLSPGAIGTAISWSTILIYGKWITGLMIGVVQDSSVELDLYHIQGLSLSSGVALLSMAFLFASWTLIAISLTGSMMRGEGKSRSFWIGVIIAITVIGLDQLIIKTDPLAWLWPLPLLVLVILGRDERRRFAFVVIGVVVIAAFTAIVLIR